MQPGQPDAVAHRARYRQQASIPTRAWRATNGASTARAPARARRDYFGEVRAARDRIVVPPAFLAAKQQQTWTAPDIERAFVASNPGLRADMMSVTCRGEVLQEVRICFSKDMRSFQSCAEVDRRGCRAPADHRSADALSRPRVRG